MNGFERYMATLDGHPVGHLARVPILMQFAAEHIGSNYGQFASDFRVLTEANLACARDFGMDQVSTISDPYRETQGFGAKIIFERDMVPHCETIHCLKIRTLRNSHDRIPCNRNACEIGSRPCAPTIPW
ncbi:MAG: uroporphyrinogen decarboxylase family protein [Verrucomicrobiales bacterium]